MYTLHGVEQKVVASFCISHVLVLRAVLGFLRRCITRAPLIDSFFGARAHLNPPI